MACDNLDGKYKLVTNPTHFMVNDTSISDTKIIIVEHVPATFYGYTKSIKNCAVYKFESFATKPNAFELVFIYQNPVNQVNVIKPNVITHQDSENINRLKKDLTINIDNITTNSREPKQYSIYIDNQLQPDFSLFFQSKDFTVVNRAAAGGKRKSRRGKKRNNRRKKTHRRR